MKKNGLDWCKHIKILTNFDDLLKDFENIAINDKYNIKGR